MTGECVTGTGTSGIVGACLRGTVGCTIDHRPEPTLLDRLDQAEHELRAAERELDMSLDLERSLGRIDLAATVNSRARLNAKSALCMAAATRCLVSVERTG